MIKSLKSLVEHACSKTRNVITIVIAGGVTDALSRALKKSDNIYKVNFIIIDNKKPDGLPENVGFLKVTGEDRITSKALELLNKNEADILMNGNIKPDKYFVPLTKKFNTKKHILSHIGVFQVPNFRRLIYVTDAGLNIKPGLAEKVEIVKNSINLAHSLGNPRPRVALLTAVEKVDYIHMPATIDAAAISKMNSTGQIKDAIVDGPLALDNAISKRAAKIKNIKSPVAGRADILVAPDIETGNILYKILVYFANANVASIIYGAPFPIIYTSRADSYKTMFYSISLGIYLQIIKT